MLESVTLPGRPSATALISTKYRPPVRGRTMPRPRLLRLLESAAEDGRQVMLVTAPAGSGKTTLLVSLAEAGERPVAWLNLDDAENDPARFLAYLLAAIDRAAPGVVTVAQGMVASDYPPPIEVILTEVINGLDAFGPLLIVLEDYHTVSEPAVHEIVGFLIDYLPAGVQLVLASRTAPGIPLSRARTRGRVLDLTLDDLRFTPEETRELVAYWSGENPSQSEVAELNARTEGWAAGLAAVLSLAQRRPGGITCALAPSEEQLAEYLASETLSCLEPRLLEFLVKTSILKRLCDDIGAAVTGFVDARELLDEAQRSILFIAPLDENRNFRRYHALFAQALRARLERDYREEIPELHRRAALWYAAHGDDASALDHAIAAGEEQLAASIVIRNANALIAHGEMRTVRSWIERLPPEQIARSVDLALPYAWALAQSGELEAAEAQLLRVDESIVRAQSNHSEAFPDITAVEGQVAALRSRIAALRDDPQETIRWTRRALELAPEEAIGEQGGVLHRGGVLLNLGHALGRLGDLDGAADAFGQAAALGPEAGPLVAALGRRYQAGVEVARGRLGSAGQLYRQAYDLAVARGFESLPALGVILEGMADLAYLRNDLDEAMRLATDALDRGKRGGEIKISVPATIVLSRVLAARGDLTGALAQIERAIALSHWPSTTAWRARFLLRAGDVAGAQRWASESGCDAVDSLESSDEFVMITYVRVLDAIGRDRDRDWLLTALRERAVSLGRVTSRIELDLLIAQVAASAGRTDEAIERLLPALSTGEQAGHIRLFLDEGRRIGPLLARVERIIDGGEDQPTTGFVARLRALLAAETPAIADDESEASGSGGLIEPLTPREREVLQLIADGHSNQAIADALYLSVGSVKAHSSHLYGKLGVRGRTEAVARARSIGLLD